MLLNLKLDAVVVNLQQFVFPNFHKKCYLCKFFRI